MSKKWVALSTGFALFSMFFGSGNLVFPLTVGQESEGHYILAAIGILLTGVVVPFLGVLGMILYKGDIASFFSSFGKKGVFIFSFLALSLMGPFGVYARCLTVAHGAVLLLLPNASLIATSLFFTAAIYFLTVRKNSIVSLLGTYLTPFLLLSIGLIVFFGIQSSAAPECMSADGLPAFKNGFFQGYQTMDLLAAFFFSQFIMDHLRKNTESTSDETAFLRIFYKAACIGGGILSFVYVSLVALGWLYSSQLSQVPPQEMLGVVALYSLGSMAAPVISLAVILACMTTAIVLASLYADFLHKDVTQGKLGNTSALIVTLAIGFFVSTLDFKGISQFLGPLLEAIYPALIALTVVNITYKYANRRKITRDPA